MTWVALMKASYSDRSAAVSNPSFARSASRSTLAWIFGSTLNAATRRADSSSRQRLNGSKRPSRLTMVCTSFMGSVVAEVVSIYHLYSSLRPIHDEGIPTEPGEQIPAIQDEVKLTAAVEYVTPSQVEVVPANGVEQTEAGLRSRSQQKLLRVGKLRSLIEVQSHKVARAEIATMPPIPRSVGE